MAVPIFTGVTANEIAPQRRIRDRNTPLGAISRGILETGLPPLFASYDPVANRQATQALVAQNTANRAIQQAAYDADKQQRIADADLSQYLPNMSLPDMSLPDSAYDFGAAVRAAPADIARHLMYPFNRAAIAVENIGTDILDSDFVGGLTGREEGVTYTEARDKAKSKLSPSGTTDDTFKEKTPEEKSQELQTAKIQTKLKDTSALDKSEGQGSGADNWFDAVNERVDLMAMGAAMLAGSSSGEGTLANLGKGLQAGIAAKKSAAQTAEAKKYRDAALALDAIRAQAASRRARAQEMAALAKDPLTYRESVDALSSELQVAGADEANTKVISQFMLGRPETSRILGMLSGNTRKKFIKDFVSGGQGWFGDEIKMDNVSDAFQTAIEKLKESK